MKGKLSRGFSTLEEVIFFGLGIIVVIMIIGAYLGAEHHKKAVTQYASGQVDASGTPIVVSADPAPSGWLWPFYWGWILGGGNRSYVNNVIYPGNYNDMGNGVRGSGASVSSDNSGAWGSEPVTAPSTSWADEPPKESGFWGSDNSDSWSSSNDSGSWGSSDDSWSSSSYDSGSWGGSSYDSGGSWGGSSGGSWGE